MLKYVAMALALTACGKGDKCEKVFDKLKPAFEKEQGSGGKTMDRDKEIGRCKEQLKTHPEREAELDCIIALPGTPSMEDLMNCDKAHGAHGGDHAKAGEAPLQLNKISKNAKRVFAETSAYPIGKVGPSPATECCKGENHKCAVDANAWKVGPWAALEFTIEEPHQYQYSYESTDGKSFTATAVGDPDCSGKPGTYTMTGSLENGNPKVELKSP